MSLEPRFALSYGTLDVTILLDPVLAECSVVDYLGGKADEVDVQVEDGQRLMRDRYWPAHGDDLHVEVGFKDGAMYGMGGFVLDEAQVDGPPWTVRIRGLSSSVKQPMRQKNSRSFENATLVDVVGRIAQDMGMQALVDLPFKIQFDSLVQHHMGGLDFLHKLLWKYGATFKLDGTSMLKVVSIEDLLLGDAVALIQPEDLLLNGMSLRSKTAQSHRSAVVRYFNPSDKNLVAQYTKPRATARASGLPFPNARISLTPDTRTVLGGPGAQDVLRILEQVQNRAEADRRASIALLHSDMGQQEGTLRLAWHPEVRAGANVFLQGFGAYVDGMYIVNRAEHRGGYGGYETHIDVSINPRNFKRPTKGKTGGQLKRLGKPK